MFFPVMRTTLPLARMHTHRVGCLCKYLLMKLPPKLKF